MIGELKINYLRLFRTAGLILLCLLFFSGSAAAKISLVKKIRVVDTPLALQVSVSREVPVKVIRISPRELLVALKNVSLAKGLATPSDLPSVIQDISVEALDGDVVALVLTANKPYTDIRTKYDDAASLLTIALEEKQLVPVGKKSSASQPISPALSQKPRGQNEENVQKTGTKPPLPVKSEPLPEVKIPVSKSEPELGVKNKPELKKAAPGEEKTAATPPEYVSPKRKKSLFKGDISDIAQVIDPGECGSQKMDAAFLRIKKELYDDAYNLLDQYLIQGNHTCLEQAYYLKAYTYYKSLAIQDYPGLIKAERMFQDALVSYPRSDLAPYAYAAMGLIHLDLKNISAAEGYFNIVKQGFPQYSGLPEVLYFLATIYDGKGYNDKALTYFKQVFESPVDHTYIPDAGVGYGKALYKKQQYYDALTIFNHVVKTAVKQLYESPDLLLNMGNANYELSIAPAARENFMRVLNLYPEVEERDVILSKVGDTYGMENKIDKALKIYGLVREKFPDSQGYVNASIGIARYVKTDQEKIEIYLMVKERFPDNTYTRIAMMRLAEIYQKNGEYNKCIKEIEDLLSTHPRGLRYEAVKLMQKAYEALFKKELEADEYTSILNRYELEHIRLEKMGSRKIEFLVGMAYLKADLHEEAFNHLIMAYKQYKRNQRSAQLLFSLGVAMDESGRDTDAVKLFASFSRRFPKDSNQVEALGRMGRLYLEQKRFGPADASLKKALALSKNPIEKGELLFLRSRVYGKKGDLKTASILQARAVKVFAEAPGKNYEILAGAYRELGTSYLELKSYAMAADAFAKALGFAEGDRTKANLGFLLGDAYQKSNRPEKAKKAYEQVVLYDSVWSRLARHRLTSLDLAENLINS